MTENKHEAAYIARINKTFDYIEANLEKPMTLEELASAASFSKFHFSRIFQSMTGETPFQFILRLRLERAAAILCSDRRDTISGIATRCGFADISVFSRNFRKYFGISASQYRAHKEHSSNLSQQQSNSEQPSGRPQFYFCPESQTLKWRTTMEQNTSVEVKELPQMTVAYIRHTGPYQGNEKLFENLWNRLFAWAGPRGLIGGPLFNMLIIYHDDPNVTSEDKLRMSVCITVPPATKVDGEVGKMEIDGGTYVVARFVVGPGEFGEAWNWLYGKWLPASGYQCDDKPCFEMYPEQPKDGKFTVDICVPVKLM